MSTFVTSNSSFSSMLSNETMITSSTKQLAQQQQQQLDKLRIIKPFDEKNLLSFYQNSLLDSNEQFISTFIERYGRKEHNEYFEMIVGMEKSIEKFQDTTRSVKQLVKNIKELEEKCWSLSEHTTQQTDRCGDGQVVEAKYQFSKSEFNEENLKSLDKFHYVLRERILNDHVVHSYYQKYYQLRFELAVHQMCSVMNQLSDKQHQLNLPIFTHQNQFHSPVHFTDDTATNYGSSVFDDDDESSVRTTQLFNPTMQMHKEKLLNWLSALFSYYRKASNSNNENLQTQCYQTIVFICLKLSKIATYHDRLFLLNQILRCPSGSSEQLASLIDRLDPMPFKHSNYEQGKHYVDYGVTMIATILSPVLDREKFLEIKTSSPILDVSKISKTPSTNNKDSAWLLVDNELEDEIITTDAILDITEQDVIVYLSRVAYNEILEFMSLINNQNSDEFNEVAHSSIETSMIRLFAFNTRLIQILRNGLRNFNCLRYKRLTLYIASMIKKIIKTISNNWQWCQQRFTTSDQALLLRLQVEFDHFMLRSITTILSTNRRGVWPLLAKIDFQGISEPMLWHILWVVYNNGRDEKNEMVSGLCPYMSANYWRDKFIGHSQWKYVFIEKLAVLSLEEASGILDFFYNMAISKQISQINENQININSGILADDGSDFLAEIIERLAEICLLKKCFSNDSLSNSSSSPNKAPQQPPLTLVNQEFYSSKGVACLVKLLNCFKTMLVSLLNFISRNHDESNLLLQPCLNLFSSLSLENWKPNSIVIAMLHKWLVDKPVENIFNRFARILFSKLGWNQTLLHDDNHLLISIDLQKAHALRIYQAVENHIVKPQQQQPQQKNGLNYKQCSIGKEHLAIDDNQKLMELAQATDTQSFVYWSWVSLFNLRLHPLDMLPDESSWDNIVVFESSKKYSSQTKHWTMHHLAKFDYDIEMVVIAKGVQEDNPMAAFISALLSDRLFSLSNSTCSLNVQKLISVGECLLKNNHHLATLHVLYRFFLYGLKNYQESFSSNSQFVGLVLSIIQKDYHEELSSIVLLHVNHLNDTEYRAKACFAWIEIFYECINQCLSLKNSSWIGSFVPSFWSLSSSSSITALVDSIMMRLTKILDFFARDLLFNQNNATLLAKVLQYLTDESYGKMENWKLSNLETLNNSSGTFFSLSSWVSQESIQYLPDKTLLRSPWVSPLHLLVRHSINSQSYDKNSSFYFSFLVIEADIRRTQKIWAQLTHALNKTKSNPNTDPSLIETELKNLCQALEKAVLPVQLLPINTSVVCLLKFISLDKHSLAKEPHHLIPLFWKQFFSLYFINTDTLSTVGNRFLNGSVIKKLIDRLNALFDYHNQNWILMNNHSSQDLLSFERDQKISEFNQSDSISKLLFEDRLVKLYRSYEIWIKEARFTSYANLDHEQFSRPEFQIKLLNYIFSTDNKKIDQYEDYDRINAYFLLNYVNKADLQKESIEHRCYWLELVKQSTTSLNIDKQQTLSGIQSHLNADSLNEFADEDMYFITNDKTERLINQIGQEYFKNDQFKQVIDHFNKMSSSTNIAGLLFNDQLTNSNGYFSNVVVGIDCYPNLNFSPTEDLDLMNSEFTVIIVIIHQIIDNVIEEARFVDNQLQKFTSINKEFSKDILPKLYTEVRREIVQKAQCDRSNFDSNGCSNPATIKFEICESVINNYIQQKMLRYQVDFDSIVNSLLQDVPLHKVIGSVYFLQKLCNYLMRFFVGDPKSEANQKRILQLFETMSGWMSSIDSISIKYHITGQVLDLLLELLHQLSNLYIDEINHFFLVSSLQRNISMSMIQQLAPCLAPSKTSALTFIEMYKLIGTNLSTVSQQTIFVLLSKFDVFNWLQLLIVSDEQRLNLLNCLFECFTFFGTTPSDEFLVTYDLYRKHLQDIILYSFPRFMPHVLNSMLMGMSQQVLAPALWNSILHTFGFYTKSLSFCSQNLTNNGSEKIYSKNEIADLDSNFCQSSVIDFDFVIFDFDLRAYLIRQKLFTSHELYDLFQLIIEFNKRLVEQFNNDVEFLDHFKIYNLKYLQFMAFVSYCWCGTNALSPPDDFNVVWNVFFDNWKVWIFPRKSTKFIQTEHLQFAWQLFINSFQFLLDSFVDGQHHFFSSLWQSFISFILETASVEKADVQMFEDKLLLLKSWSCFYPSLDDMKLMYESAALSRYSVDRLNANIIAKINWHHVLFYSPLSNDQVIQIVENLTYTLMLVSNQVLINEVDFDSIPFMVLNYEKSKQVLSTLLDVMKKRITIEELVEIEKTYGNVAEHHQAKIIIKLLKSVAHLTCYNIPMNDDVNVKERVVRFVQSSQTHQVSKTILYAHCIGLFISHIGNTSGSISSESFRSIQMFLKNTMETMIPVINNFTNDDRVSIFCELLQSINEIQDETIRTKLSVQFATILSYLTSAEFVAESMIAIGKIIFFVQISVYLLECLIENYFDLSGHFNFLVDNLEIVHVNKSINNGSIEDFILESIKSRSCLLLLVHFYSRLRHRTVPDVCTRKYVFNILTQSASQIKFSNDYMNESKICFFYTRVFDLLTFDHSSIDNILNISVHNISSLRSSFTHSDSFKKILAQSDFSNKPNLDVNNEEVFSSVQTLTAVCKSINASITESLNRGFLGLFRSSKAPSNNFIFLLQCLVLHGARTVLETFFSESLDDLEESGNNGVHLPSTLYSDNIKQQLKKELFDLCRLGINRLYSWKKNKSFSELLLNIEEMLSWVHMPKSYFTDSDINNIDNSDRLSSTPGSPSNTKPMMIVDDNISQDSLSLDENLLLAHKYARNYIHIQEFQKKRFQFIHKSLIDFYPDKQYMKHFYLKFD